MYIHSNRETKMTIKRNITDARYQTAILKIIKWDNKTHSKKNIEAIFKETFLSFLNADIYQLWEVLEDVPADIGNNAIIATLKYLMGSSEDGYDLQKYDFAQRIARRNKES